MDFAGIDKFSLLDYDEMISIVLFAPGCNFRCPFCHNIEAVVDSKERIPFDEIMEYLSSRKGVIDAVVISGGEPTLMPELKDRIIKIKELGYKIKLDTNGTNPRLLKELINEKLIDYVAMDVKNSIEKYPLTTGIHGNFDVVVESINLLKEGKVDYEFRTTLVDEFHSEKTIKDMGELVKGAKKLYLQKYVYREGVIAKSLHPVEEIKAKSFVEILKNFVNKVELRGY
ncbi:MAG: anaerobic ribonucleoside-triphosphate reductase activating protein [Bacilli bacterium]|nr:anaerobic ribonucleoside-triphosphate reductase activating protein [Bacilli bacterium]